MKLKPTFSSFLLRYFIFTYFLIWSIFAIVIKDEVGLRWYIFLWIVMTVIPAIIHAFKRVKFGWFFWIGMLDLVAFLPKIKPVYSKMIALSTNENYQGILEWFQNLSEVKVYVFVSIISIIITQLYRLTFSYEVNEASISLRSGIFSRKDRTIISAHITDLDVVRGFFQRIVGIGTIIPITSSGIGTGANTVFGGIEAQSKAGLGGVAGGARSERVEIVDPTNSIYGIKNPEKIKEEILLLIQTPNVRGSNKNKVKEKMYKVQ